MILITTVRELQEALQREKSKGKTIGFVPTMGALHDGHMALIDAARAQCDVVVASIFVNPTQFNESSDLEKYPRTPESDHALLNKHDCDVLFFPSVDEMYPGDTDTSIQMDFNGIDRAMEGAFRPGHFEGVAQVIHRFLDVLAPDAIFMGQKDYQQVRVVELVTEQLNHSTSVVMVPTVRHDDGLAQSSRNLRLLPEHRKKANVIFRTLSWAKEQVSNRAIEEVKAVAMANLTVPGFKPEYFEIIDGQSFEKLEDWDHETIVACTAVWAGEVRLIDNMILRGDRA